MTILTILGHFFLSHKKDTFVVFQKLANFIQNEKKGFKISSIRSDHIDEFQNVKSENFCIETNMDHTFSSPRTLQ